MKVRLSYTTTNCATMNSTFGWTDVPTGEARWKVEPGHRTKTLTAQEVADRKKRRVTYNVPLRNLPDMLMQYGAIDSINIRSDVAILYMTREVNKQDALQVPYSTTFEWHIELNKKKPSCLRVLRALVEKTSPSPRWESYLKRELQ